MHKLLTVTKVFKKTFSCQMLRCLTTNNARFCNITFYNFSHMYNNI